MEQLAADFVGHLDRMSPGISYFIGQLEDEPALLDTEDGARELSAAIREMSAAAAASLPQVSLLADGIGDLGKVSNRLRPVSRRMSNALRKVFGTSRTIQDWGRRLKNLDDNAA